MERGREGGLEFEGDLDMEGGRPAHRDGGRIGGVREVGPGETEGDILRGGGRGEGQSLRDRETGGGGCHGGRGG